MDVTTILITYGYMPIIGLFYGPQKKLELEKGKFKDNYI